MAGAVTATILTVNYAGLTFRWVEPWWHIDRTLGAFIVFWLLFLMCTLSVRYLIQRITQIIRWERMHWAIQGLGLVLGTARGFWWAGFMTLALASSGFAYLQDSVERQSWLGRSIVAVAQPAFEEVSDLFPGSQHRGQPLFPSAKVTPAPS